MRLLDSAKKLIVAAMVAASFFVMSRADTPLAGKAGAELKEAVAASYRPSRLVSSIEIDDAIADLWSSVPLGFPVNIAHRKWWELTPVYGDTVSRNLYNTVAIPSALVVERGQWPAGEVEVPTVSANGWVVGMTDLWGTTTGFFSPPDNLKGDIARAMFYMATLYPSTFWGNYALAVLEDNRYPTLSVHGIAVYLRWHHNDPVDRAERNRVASVAARQGASNPFVDMPLLADYIWGIYSDRPFEDDDPDVPGQSGTDDSQVDDSPLRSTYSLADSRINLYHPAIPADARWQVDGRDVSEPFVNVIDLGAGIHQLTFTAADGITGHVKIIIK